MGLEATKIMTTEQKFTEADRRLILLIREVRHGRLTVFIQDGEPVRAEETLKSIKLK